jgi:hypothetical protein
MCGPRFHLWHACRAEWQLIPLAKDAGDRWPATLPVTVSGFETRGIVVWLGASDNGQRTWTRSPDQADVRAITDAPSGAPPEQTGAVFALVELPSLYGRLQVAGVDMDPNWLSVAPPLPANEGVMQWPANPGLDLPDAGTPSEYWRWCLVATRRGQQPPPARGTIPEQLWARHVSSLWMAGLERVRQVNKDAHAQLIHALTCTASDKSLPPPGNIAAWIATTDDLQALLSVLLSASARSFQTTQSALSWLNAHWPITMWVEADAGDRVRLVVANPSDVEQVLRVTWLESVGALPTSIATPAGSVVRHWIDRPQLPPTGDPMQVDRMRPEKLDIVLGERRTQIAIGPREYSVRPPGLSFGTLAASLTLADAQAARMAPPPSAWATTASLRRRLSKWEILVECMRPPIGEGVADDSNDEVTLRIGDPEAPLRTVRVSADGALAVDGGLTDGATAGFLRWPDRWRARIEIPAAWIPSAASSARGVSARPVMLALERRPGSGLPRQTGGLALPPWVRVPAAVIVDLGTWTETGSP